MDLCLISGWLEDTACELAADVARARRRVEAGRAIDLGDFVVRHTLLALLSAAQAVAARAIEEERVTLTEEVPHDDMD